MIRAARRLAVLGSPISHSRSPAVHAAAYDVLDLDWDYSAVEVASGGLREFLGGLDSSWRGVSLTMPLKREVLPLVTERDEVSLLVGAANTVLLDGDEVRGFNTDVYGAEMMLRESLTTDVHRVALLGGGATACSLLVALVNLGAREFVVSTRSPEKSVELARIADSLGVALSVGDFGVDVGSPNIVVSTLPGTAPLARQFSEEFRHSVPLIDVAYDPWPTPLAQHWIDGEGSVTNSGLDMLVHQALAQVRIFVAANPATPLRDEPLVLKAMKQAATAAS